MRGSDLGGFIARKGKVREERRKNAILTEEPPMPQGGDTEGRHRIVREKPSGQTVWRGGGRLGRAREKGFRGGKTESQASWKNQNLERWACGGWGGKEPVTGLVTGGLEGIHATQPAFPSAGVKGGFWRGDEL